MWPFGIGPLELALAVGIIGLLLYAGKVKDDRRKVGFCYLGILGLVAVYALVNSLALFQLLR